MYRAACPGRRLRDRHLCLNVPKRSASGFSMIPLRATARGKTKHTRTYVSAVQGAICSCSTIGAHLVVVLIIRGILWNKRGIQANDSGPHDQYERCCRVIVVVRAEMEQGGLDPGLSPQLHLCCRWRRRAGASIQMSGVWPPLRHIPWIGRVLQHSNPRQRPC